MEIYRELGTNIVIPHDKFVIMMADRILAAFHREYHSVVTSRKVPKKRIRSQAIDADSSTEEVHLGMPLLVMITLKQTGRNKNVDVPRTESKPLPIVHELQLPFLYRVNAELLHLINEEESVRSKAQPYTKSLGQRHLNATSRREEEPTMEIGRLDPDADVGVSSAEQVSVIAHSTGRMSGGRMSKAASFAHYLTPEKPIRHSRMGTAPAVDSLPALASVHCKIWSDYTRMQPVAVCASLVAD